MSYRTHVLNGSRLAPVLRVPRLPRALLFGAPILTKPPHAFVQADAEADLYPIAILIDELKARLPPQSNEQGATWQTCA